MSLSIEIKTNQFIVLEDFSTEIEKLNQGINPYNQIEKKEISIQQIEEPSHSLAPNTQIKKEGTQHNKG
ncbi:32314_t:CDS:1, partial [Gigaspora margarita]